MDSSAYAALRCPACGAAPEPARDDCPHCGRRLRTPAGALDLLPDDLREEADLFVAEYSALRAREAWADRGRARRSDAVAAAVASLRAHLGTGALIVDVGSGPAPASDVITVDLVEGAAIRGDMRRLPFRDRSVDGILYAASLHYAALDESTREAARVLRPGGLMAALDSPLYRGSRAVRQAVHRTAAHYESMGHPALEAHYHPIEVGALRAAMAARGFEVIRLVTGSPWRRLLRRGPTSFVLARRLR